MQRCPKLEIEKGLQVMDKLVQIAQSSQKDCLHTHSKQMADEVVPVNY